MDGYSENAKGLKICAITRENYKNFEWDEGVKFEYRGLRFECDHERDAGIFFIWLDMPHNGAVPYNNIFDAGLYPGEPRFLSTVTEIMDFVDKYYEGRL